VANTLHIIKSAGAIHPWDVLGDATDSRTIVLIQDAVTSQPTVAGPIFALARDAKARGVRETPYPLIEDERLLELIWAADRVVVW
jgi:hypothetical protein